MTALAAERAVKAARENLAELLEEGATRWAVADAREALRAALFEQEEADRRMRRLVAMGKED